MKEETSILITLCLVAVTLGSWITHIIHCLLHAKYLLLIAGTLVFPVGMVHGLGIWFGVNW